METQEVSITVLSVDPSEGNHVYAVIAVELLIAGVAIELRGITARHVPGGGTAIYLPQHRTAAGEGRASVQLPPDLREKVCDEVLAHLVRTGVGRARYAPAEA